MPLQATSGAATYDAFGGGVPVVPVPKNYIEDVFSTWLYTGNGSTQTITNGIDLAGEGGLTWIKSRSAATNNFLFDTTRGALNQINSNTTDAQSSLASSLTAFNANGFSLGSAAGINVNAATYVAWTFRKQPKFFDIVTYTGNGTAGRTVAHNLGSVPGCIIIKNLTTSGTTWCVYHKDISGYIQLQSTSAASPTIVVSNVTSTSFDVAQYQFVNGDTESLVAFVFAHNAGGFGESETENVISCGAYTGNGLTNGPFVNLGYEPQFLLIKSTSSSGNWYLIDTMRGFPVGTGDAFLNPNASASESTGQSYIDPYPTGFKLTTNLSLVNGSGVGYIYMAIRRGPMKVPTSGQSVFGLSARTGTGVNATVSGSAGVSDAVLIKNRGSAVADLLAARLTQNLYLQTSTTNPALVSATVLQTSPWDVMDGVKVGTTSTTTNASGSTFINYLFDRAPNFMDIVCYVGTGSANTLAHNLKAVPEFIIVKVRNNSFNWAVYSSAIGATQGLWLNTTDAAFSANTFWNSTAPTESVFTVNTNNAVNTTTASANYISFLFATCPGVSKVGSYTGTAATLQIDCGFTGGARFVLIKRTDSTGSWYVWDSARGIVAGDDPYFLLNSAAAEVTNTDYIDTYSAGFEITSTAPADINASGGTFIFLAIS